MPTRTELEEALGKRWAAMARKEGHVSAMPINSKAPQPSKKPIDAETLRGIIELNLRSYEELVQKYGYGVRPSWVSADLARYQTQITRARRALEKIK